ncbi:hypothetical protein [Hymenobacter terricola]|uniref:hypothetical protein n=1 Tax=Hymenobacter terricola TaxID=2819236 RepID=UPI001B305000|nr:hypothetical protein [Hymenobacter terricola]
MAVNYASLTDWATCDTATAEIDFKLQVYTTHEVVDQLADKRSQRSKTSTSSELAAVNSKITAADILLATAGIEPGLVEKTTDERAALLVRRTTLTKRGRSTTGLDEFMGEVEGEQADTQVTALTTIKNGIVAHRATLTA